MARLTDEQKRELAASFLEFLRQIKFQLVADFQVGNRGVNLLVHKYHRGRMSEADDPWQWLVMLSINQSFSLRPSLKLLDVQTEEVLNNSVTGTTTTISGEHHEGRWVRFEVPEDCEVVFTY